jgi:hypothetical protein
VEREKKKRVKMLTGLGGQEYETTEKVQDEAEEMKENVDQGYAFLHKASAVWRRESTVSKICYNGGTEWGQLCFVGHQVG